MSLQLPPPLPARRIRVRRTDEDVEDAFGRWYALYPRKRSPDAARRAYRAALNRGASTTELLEGARRYAAQVVGEDKKFIQHPSTWLNGSWWLSAPEEQALPATVVHRSARYVLERELFPARGRDFCRHLLSYLVLPAERLGLAGADDRGALAAAVGRLYLRVEDERRRAGFSVADYDALGSDSELVRRYLDWLAGQDWHSATLAVLGFDSPALGQFRREAAAMDQCGRDPIMRRSRFVA